jgi:hypothetical protein
MSVAYVDGSGASGVYGNDTIVVAGSSATWEVGVAITENTAYTADDIVSGIIGMSYGNPEENSTRVDRTSNPAWWAFVHEWTNEEFGLYVAPPENVTSYVDWTTHPRGSETELGGLLTLGGVEENLFKDKLNYVPIVNGTAGVDWEIPVDAVNGVAVDRTTAFIDSGTSFLMGPTDQIRQGLLGQNVDARLDTVGDGSQYFTYSCQYANSIEWTFTFGGQNYTIPSQYLSQEFDGLGRCMFVIVPDSENNYYIVGDAFLYGVYSAYRAGNNPAVGLAHVSDDAQKWLAAYSKNGGVEPSGFVSDSASATGSGSASKPSSSTVSSNNAAGALAPSFGALLVASLAAFFL